MYEEFTIIVSCDFYNRLFLVSKNDFGIRGMLYFPTCLENLKITQKFQHFENSQN